LGAVARQGQGFRTSGGASVIGRIAWFVARKDEPTVMYEIHYVPHEVPISRVCRLVWNRADIMPGPWFDMLQENLQYRLRRFDDPVIKRRTYAACARPMLQVIQSVGSFCLWLDQISSAAVGIRPRMN
jgi:hypothetical protein